MSTEKMNAEFEIWRKEQIASLVRMGYPGAAKAFRDLGSVQWAGFQAGWIASRAAIEIDLPPSGGEKGCFWREDVIEAIESIGLKVKP